MIATFADFAAEIAVFRQKLWISRSESAVFMKTVVFS